MPCARATIAVAALLSLFLQAFPSVDARPVTPLLEQSATLPDDNNIRRLKEGEVIVDAVDRGSTRYVVAKILINDSPQSVWRVLTNPFEFKRKISPRMKDVEMLVDASTRSVMRCKVEIFPPVLPFITYTVESEYKPYEHVYFKRVDGMLKDFKGAWYLSAKDGGSATEVTYQMYIDPGMPVPQWIIRKAIRIELPRTLVALRKRITSSDTAGSAEPVRTIMAVGEVPSPIVDVAGPIGGNSSSSQNKSIERSKPILKPRHVSSSTNVPEL